MKVQISIISLLALFVLLFSASGQEVIQPGQDSIARESPVTAAVPDNDGGKRIPFALPVVTPEEAEKLNEEILPDYEILLKKREKEKERLERGYVLAVTDQFHGQYKAVALSKANEDLIVKKGYLADDFRAREIPSGWSVDFATIPDRAEFQKTEDGYSVVSDQGPIRFVGQWLNGMRSSFHFELNVRNESETESEIVLGVRNSGILKNGYKTLATEKIPGRQEKKLEVELSVFEQLANIAPTISVQGAVTLEDLTIYRKDHEEFTIVEGEIVERSELPDPADTDYPDCRFTVHFMGNTILSGMPCNKELALSMDGFLKKKVLPTNDLKSGDKIKCAIVPVDSVPDEIASIQEADDLLLFTLDSYFVTTCSKISAYTDLTQEFNALIPFKSDSFEFKSVFNRGFNPPIPDELKEAQKKQIEKDLAEAKKMIAYLEENRDDIERKFQSAWSKEKERFPDGFNTIKDEKGNISLYWRNVDNSFWCLPPAYTLIPKKPHEIPEDKLEAIKALKDFLESNGVQLIVSLVPDRYTVSSRVINPDFRDVPDYQGATYVKQLSEIGVECPYESAKIIENYNKFPFAYLFPLDNHPGATTQYAIAKEMGERLSRFNFPKKYDKTLFTYVPAPTFNIPTNYRFPSNCDIGNNTSEKQYLSEAVYYDGKALSCNNMSEILTVGNSFIQSPILFQRSFPCFLSERILYPVDQYTVSSQGPMTTIIQRIFENPESFLKEKKMVILQMSIGNASSNIVWNNIADMNRKKLLLNGKKLIATLHISGNGDYSDDFVQSNARDAWKEFEGKNDIKCLNNAQFEIFHQPIPGIDVSSPFVCVVQTVRSPLFSVPTLIANGTEEVIPSSHDSTVLFWQDVYFQVPAGTTELKLELQGQKGTIVGFNKVLIYQ